jgi:hypothetical protein
LTTRLQGWLKSLEPREITPEMQARFQSCAPAALARRSPAYLAAMQAGSLQWVLIGMLGLAGLYLWRWPALDFLLLLIAACVMGALMDTLRWLVARRRLDALVAHHNDDNFVWALAGALRSGQTRVEAGNLMRYRAGVALVLEWLLLPAALVLLAGVLLPVLPGLVDYFAGSRSLQWSLLIAVLLPVIAGALSIRAWRGAGSDGPVLQFAAGARGVLLLAVAIAVLATRSSESRFFTLIVSINAAMLCLGLIGVFGTSILRKDTDWLRRYLVALRAPRT